MTKSTFLGQCAFLLVKTAISNHFKVHTTLEALEGPAWNAMQVSSSLQVSPTLKRPKDASEKTLQKEDFILVSNQRLHAYSFSDPKEHLSGLLLRAQGNGPGGRSPHAAVKRGQNLLKIALCV